MLKKIKHYFAFDKLKKWVFVFDFVILALLNNSMTKYKWVTQILMVVLLVWNVICFYRVWVSSQKAKIDVKNYRVMCASGEPGLGKSSYMGQITSICAKNRPIITNVPYKVNGKFTYVLSKDALGMCSALPEKSFVLMDEISLYYNNLDKPEKSQVEKFRLHIKGFEAFLQLIRHNFDGNFFCASVNMGRIMAVLEEKVGLENRLLEQTSINNAFVFPFVYNFFRWVRHKPVVYFGVRRWKIQKFLKIQKDGYIYDLSTDNANTKTNKFTSLIYFYAWNSNSFEYDDRFASALYKTIPKEKLKKYTSLTFKPEDLAESGFDSLKEIYIKGLENIKKGEDFFSADKVVKTENENK